MAVHELRSTAGVLVGSAQTLARMCEDVPLPPRGAEILALLDRSAHSLTTLISDLLTSAYLEHGTVPIAPAPVALRDVLERSIGAVTDDDGRVLIDCDHRLQVIVDADRLEQVVTNLVANGLEHGVPRVVVTASVPTPLTFEVVVGDRGDGVDPIAAEHLFERFGRLSARRSTSTGLGLSIARGLARAMGGDLVYERLDPGSRFVLTLPNAGTVVPLRRRPERITRAADGGPGAAR